MPTPTIDSLSEPTKTVTDDDAALGSRLLSDAEASCRLPVLYLLFSGVAWLLISTALGFLASVKLHQPELFAQWEWCLYGRLQPASMTAFIYGFASQTGLGVGLWILARLGRSGLGEPGLAFASNICWNLALTIGVAAILLGQSTGYDGMEMPGYASGLLLLGYAGVAAWGAIAVLRPGFRTLYASEWYLLGAFFWFPWALATAQVLLLLFPVRGVLQTVINGWYLGVLFYLWLAPLGVAALYYFIPALSGRPIRNYFLACWGFWLCALLGGWTGLTRYVGGPLPAWMITVSIAASVLMLIPVAIWAVNHHGTLGERLPDVWRSPVLRFLGVGALCLTAVFIGLAVNSFRTVSGLTHSTARDMAHTQLLLQGFIAMTFYGGLYYIVPRLVEHGWPDRWLITVHFWLAVIGLALTFLPLLIGGIVQGLAMNRDTVPWDQVISRIMPYLKWRTFGMVILGLGHLALAANLALMLAAGFRPMRQAYMALAQAEADTVPLGK